MTMMNRKKAPRDERGAGSELEHERLCKQIRKSVTAKAVVFSVLTALYSTAFLLYSAVVNEPVGEAIILASIIAVAAQAGQMWEKRSYMAH